MIADRPGVRRGGPAVARLLGVLRIPLLAALVAGSLVGGCGAAVSPTPVPASSASAPAILAIDQVSGLPVIEVVDLPPEALVTIRRIRAGGPFPYPQDGVVFVNREGLLPAHPPGWYHEYTVETPGSADRGARRIVTGTDGTFYWTDDHYASFRVIRR